MFPNADGSGDLASAAAWGTWRTVRTPPVLLLYGGQDKVVNPAINCELFIERFKRAGGKAVVENRTMFGHHPHGVDPDKTKKIVDFFK